MSVIEKEIRDIRLRNLDWWLRNFNVEKPFDIRDLYNFFYTVATLLDEACREIQALKAEIAGLKKRLPEEITRA